MTSRPFVPIDSFERLRRIREVWEIRRRDNELRDSGFSVSLATQCTNELRAIAEEEAALAIDLLKRMRDAAKEILNTPTNQFYFCTAVDRIQEVIAEFEASDADG